VERLTTALRVQVERFARATSGARRGEVTAVHQARVASRRLRELLPIAAWAGPADVARRARVEVRRVTQTLGAVREVDVTKDVLEQGAVRHGWPPEPVVVLRRRLDTDRRRYRAALVATLRNDCARQMFRDLRRVVADMPRVGPTRRWQDKLESRRRRRANALALRLRELGALYVPVRLHAVRIAAKKLRYSLEADRDIRGAAVIRDIRTLEGIQEYLGHLHDLQILQDRVHGTRQLQRMRGDLEGECRAMHAQVLARMQRWLALADRVAAR
jgi:CHAD domain-containing protein